MEVYNPLSTSRQDNSIYHGVGKIGWFSLVDLVRAFLEHQKLHELSDICSNDFQNVLLPVWTASWTNAVCFRYFFFLETFFLTFSCDVASHPFREISLHQIFLGSIYAPLFMHVFFTIYWTSVIEPHVCNLRLAV